MGHAQLALGWKQAPEGVGAPSAASVANPGGGQVRPLDQTSRSNRKGGTSYQPSIHASEVSGRGRLTSLGPGPCGRRVELADTRCQGLHPDTHLLGHLLSQGRGSAGRRPVPRLSLWPEPEGEGNDPA